MRPGARGGWTTCWTPFRSSGPGPPTFSSPFTRRRSSPRLCSSIVSQIAERAPVELLVEEEADGADVALVRVAVVEGRSRGSQSAPPKSAAGSTSPNEASSTSAVGFSRASRARSSPGVRQVGLRDDQPVGGGRLLDRLRLAQPVLRVHRRDHALEPEVVLDDRLGQQRVEDRRRVGEPGRLDDDAPERRDLARARAGRAGRAARRRGRRAASSRRSRSSAAPSARRRGAAGGGRSPPRRAR